MYIRLKISEKNIRAFKCCKLSVHIKTYIINTYFDKQKITVNKFQINNKQKVLFLYNGKTYQGHQAKIK